MSTTLIEIIADYLGYNPEVALEICNKAQKSYRKYNIKKKKGGNRTIFHPSKLTKSLQYAIIEIVLRELPVHQSAAGYIRGIKSPLFRNATKHARFRYSVRIDFEDFFPSLCPNDLIKIVKSFGKFKDISKDDEEFLTKSLFAKYPKGQIGLPIGAPSSPIISNIVMFSLDEKINKLAISTSVDSVYTRYADDLVFSSNEKGACKEFYDAVIILINNTKSPNLKINKEKTVFTSRGIKRVITGLYVCPDGGVSIGRNNKRYIRKLLLLLKHGELDKKTAKYLSGYLSFILDVEPDFYNRLVIKYGAETVSKARTGNIEDSPI